MTDLTKLTTPFGLLDADTQKALREWPYGWELYSLDGNWYTTTTFPDYHRTYRARPAPVTPDTIDWSHVAPEWKWMARDDDGLTYFHNVKPVARGSSWIGNEYAEVTAFASYQIGTVNWQDSLVERPA